MCTTNDKGSNVDIALLKMIKVDLPAIKQMVPISTLAQPFFVIASRSKVPTEGLWNPVLVRGAKLFSV